MRKIGLLLLSALMLAVIGAYSSSTLTAPLPDHPYFEDTGILAMAHRGGARLWPEHTLYGYRRAVELGVDVLDLDIWLTSDGVIVVHHDRTVDRTTYGTGRVSRQTLAVLQSLEAGSDWSQHRGRGLRIPTLRSVFETFPKVRYNIDIKSDHGRLEGRLCELIHQFGLERRTMVVSAHTGAIERFRRICPEVATSGSFMEIWNFYWLHRLGLDWLWPSPPVQAFQIPEYLGPIHAASADFIGSAHARNIKVLVWTVNDVAAMHRLIGLGVDGINTDYPNLLLESLGRQ